MAWDPVWEKIFKERGTWGQYPPESLIRFIANNYYKVVDRKKIKILDLGCGTGACIWYLAREGFSASGIDGSATALDLANVRLKREALDVNLQIGHLNELPWNNNTFDCAIDVAALQHNTLEITHDIVDELYRVLKPGGKHFSITSKSNSWGDKTGIKLDAVTYENVKFGPFKNMGVIRFSRKRDILDLYRDFSEIYLESETRSFNNNSKFISNWIVSCQK